MVRQRVESSFSIIRLRVSKRAVHFVCIVGTLKFIKKNHLKHETRCLRQRSLSLHGLKAHTEESAHIVYLEPRLQWSSCHKHYRIRNRSYWWAFAIPALQLLHGILELYHISYLEVILIMILNISVWQWLWTSHL